MSVFVDNMRAKYGRMVMCHMVADTTDELLAMADRIGVARKWLQKAGTAHEHFDICLRARAEAVKNGAVEVTRRELFNRITRERKVPPPPPKHCTRCGLGEGEWRACEEFDCVELK